MSPIKNTVADRVALVQMLLGEPESICSECGSTIPETGPFITKEEAIELLNIPIEPEVTDE